MDSNMKPTLSEAHPETMDFLSKAWCNFAVQSFQPELLDQSIILHQNSIGKMDLDINPHFLKMEKSVKMENSARSIPPWKSNDVKSWIWMQQAMHPELNYNSCFTKKWFPWKIVSLKNVSIKKWIKEIKQKRKEDQRLHRAEVHAALSVAGVAAALAAIAAENPSKHDVATARGSTAVASAAALVAAQCAQVAEAMGAKKEELRSVMSSAMSGTNASDILTLTAAAATSIRGASTLKARTGCNNRLNGRGPVLPIDQEKTELDFNFQMRRSILAKGAQINIETPDGRCMTRSISITLSNEAQVIVKIKKRKLSNPFGSIKESIILELHVELYKETEADEIDTCYLIVLTTNNGVIKLDMMDDYNRYTTWAETISRMLMLSSSFTKYELRCYKN